VEAAVAGTEGEVIADPDGVDDDGCKDERGGPSFFFIRIIGGFVGVCDLDSFDRSPLPSTFAFGVSSPPPRFLFRVLPDDDACDLSCWAEDAEDDSTGVGGGAGS
jgi:hypothetical protein